MNINQFQRASGTSQALADIRFPHVVVAMREFGIDTPKRQAHFLALVEHDFADFTKTEAGLNYIASTLNTMFRKRNTLFQVKACGRNTAHSANRCMIASIIYANRNGNISIASGGGYSPGYKLFASDPFSPSYSGSFELRP